MQITEVYSAQDALYSRVSDAGINEVRRQSYAQDAEQETLRLPYPANIAAIDDDASDAVVLSASSWIRSPASLSLNAVTRAIAENDTQPVGKLIAPMTSLPRN